MGKSSGKKLTQNALFVSIALFGVNCCVFCVNCCELHTHDVLKVQLYLSSEIMLPRKRRRGRPRKSNVQISADNRGIYRRQHHAACMRQAMQLRESQVSNSSQTANAMPLSHDSQSSTSTSSGQAKITNQNAYTSQKTE